MEYRSERASTCSPLACSGERYWAVPIDRGGLRHRHAGVAHGAGDAEVHDLDLAGAGQHDVGRLDVAVDDAGPVAVLQRLEDADGHLQGPLGQQLAAGVQQLTQRGAVDVLHDDVRDRDVVDVVLAGVVDAPTIDGMVERGGRLGLSAEPGLEGRVAREVRPQRLHRDGAARAGCRARGTPRPCHRGRAPSPARTGRRGDAALP